MTPAYLSSESAKALDEAKVLLRETKGFLFLPVFAPAERAARMAYDRLRPEIDGEPFRIAWPALQNESANRELEAKKLEEGRMELLRNLDRAIVGQPSNTVLVLNACGEARARLALQLAPYLNLRREPLRNGNLRLILLWPTILREELMAGAPDLWSMRAASLWADEVNPVEYTPSGPEATDDTPIAAKQRSLSPGTVEGLNRWRVHRSLGDAGLSSLDALALVRSLASDGQFAEALDLAEHVANESPDGANAMTPLAEKTRADAKTQISVLRAQLGNLPASIGPAREALEIFRRLAEVNPVAYEPSLANSLLDYSNHLRLTGQTRAALDLAQEAAAIFRRLNTAEPTEYEAELAYALKQASICLSEVGERAAAIAPAKEALKIYRDLAQLNPTDHVSDFASSLSNMANRFDEVGETGAALLLAKEALTIRRKLAEEYAGEYSPLVNSLHNTANFLVSAGESEAALELDLEALAICRRMVKDNAAAHEPGLATALNNLAQSMFGSGKTTLALEYAMEALAIRRRLAAADSERYEPTLANSLMTLSKLCAELDRRNDALAPAQEALDLYCQLERRNPTIYRARKNAVTEFVAHLQDPRPT